MQGILHQKGLSEAPTSGLEKGLRTMDRTQETVATPRPATY